MAKVTRAVTALERAGVEFTVHTYELTGSDDETTYGEAVAAEVGVEPARLFKTLLVSVDGTPTVGIVPVSGRLSMKSLARAAGGKRAEMIAPTDAERLTGYVTGGISPFGQRRRLPVVVDRSALDHETIFCSAGRRGLQVEVAPADMIRILSAEVAEIADH